MKFLKYWDHQSFHISVITVKPSYFYAEDQELAEEIPSQADVYYTGSLDPFRVFYVIGKLFRKYLKQPTSSDKESGSLMRKLSGFFFLPDSRLLWLPFALFRLWKINRIHSVDLIYVTAPPFTTGLIGVMAKRMFKKPVVLDLRDAWTNNPYLPKLTFLHHWFQERLEKSTISHCDGITFVNPNLQAYYLKKYPWLSNSASEVIRNGYDPVDFSKNYNQLTSTGSLFKIGILGTIYSQGNAPWLLIESISKLIYQKPELRKRIRIVFIGKWSGDFLRKIRRFRIDTILEWIDYLPHKKALTVASTMNSLALAVEGNLTGSENVTPGRIYEYLYLKKPILAICPDSSDLAFLIRYCEAGEVVSNDNVEELTSILLKWLDYPEQLNQKYKFKNLEEFSRINQTKQLLNFLSNRLP